MKYFSGYRRFYKEPERYTSDIARQKRYEAALTKERERLAVPFSFRLSPAKEGKVNTTRRVAEDRREIGPKAASIVAALGSFKESDFADPAKRLEYRRLRAAQGQQRARPAGSDARAYSPYPHDFAKTVSGTWAKLFTSSLSRSLPSFQNAFAVVPCVERMVRREVLFAKGHGGRGYRVPHRRGPFSGIPC